MKRTLLSTSLLLGCAAGYSASTTAGPAASESPPPTFETSEAVPMADPRIPPGKWTLEEKQYWIKLQDELDEYVARANEACGAKLTGRFVHESFRGRMTAGGYYGLDLDTRALCGQLASSLVEVCNGGPTAKEAVATQLRKLECEYGPARYWIKDGLFHASINTEPKTKDTNYNAMLAVIKKSL
jgi:hypothetical protein